MYLPRIFSNSKNIYVLLIFIEEKVSLLMSPFLATLIILHIMINHKVTHKNYHFFIILPEKQVSNQDPRFANPPIVYVRRPKTVVDHRNAETPCVYKRISKEAPIAAHVPSLHSPPSRNTSQTPSIFALNLTSTKVLKDYVEAMSNPSR